MLTAERYFHTLRYLKPVQIYGRLWHTFYHPQLSLNHFPAKRVPLAGWQQSPMKPISLIAENRFRFLNEEKDLIFPSAWTQGDLSKLWLYNLHYFDDVNSEKAVERRNRHSLLISKWITENHPGKGLGWEPYPLSLRIVNWIKWILRGESPPDEAITSLAIQGRLLAAKPEYHLLGNHLLANAKALVFAGLFFEGAEAESWLVKGLRILTKELKEQILEDGGHFERSPMYHSIILEDLLDLINLFGVYGLEKLDRSDRSRNSEIESLLEETARVMLAWLRVMCHPDGQIVLFNDAALEIAPSPEILINYAQRLGIEELEGKKISHSIIPFGQTKVTHLKDTGYLRVDHDSLTVFLDVGLIGPDYLPGHAHADTLSFEMSLNNQRVIVDSGTSTYEKNLERLRQRGTSAHNTVTINGENSSEVWGGFRVARRAKPFGLEIAEQDGKCRVICSHDGFRRLEGKPVHRREWRFESNRMEIRDVITGNSKNVVGRFHFHPDLEISSLGNESKGRIAFRQEGIDRRIEWKVVSGSGKIVQTTWHPEFGKCILNRCLEIAFAGPEAIIQFSW